MIVWQRPRRRRLRLPSRPILAALALIAVAVAQALAASLT